MVTRDRCVTKAAQAHAVQTPVQTSCVSPFRPMPGSSVAEYAQCMEEASSLRGWFTVDELDECPRCREVAALRDRLVGVVVCTECGVIEPAAATSA